MAFPRRVMLALGVAVLVTTAACSRAPEALTPEAAKAKGDALLKEMSANATNLQTFSYTADEVREKGKEGAREVKRATRQVTIRRPNALVYTVKGDDIDAAGYYDGKSITIVANRLKKWARGPMPPTLDEAIDYMSAEYAMELPGGDLLYSSPYEALMTPETTGGWVDVQQIGDRRCDHLAYHVDDLDWEIWLNEQGRLPCQARITYKGDPGQPVTTVTYRDLERSPQVSDATFTATVPADYERIKIIRHATVEDPTVADEPIKPEAKK
jgi:hypothetical protein